jgi:hypothetical protein
MAYRNLNVPANFQLASFGQNGFRKLDSNTTLSDPEEFYNCIVVLSDASLTVTALKGDNLSDEFIPAGTAVYGLFSSASVASGICLCYIA